MVEIVIGLGSNLGDPVSQIRGAARFLERAFRHTRLSPLVASEPMYFADQPPFVNAVVIAETDLAPLEVFGVLKTAEHALGRQATFANGPRLIDLDLLIYGCIHYRFDFSDGSNLIVPHPRIAERLFVMQPWLALHPLANLPGRGPVTDLVARLAQARLAEVQDSRV